MTRYSYPIPVPNLDRLTAAIRLLALSPSFYLTAENGQVHVDMASALSSEEETSLNDFMATHADGLEDSKLNKIDEVTAATRGFVHGILAVERQQSLATLLMDALAVVFVVEAPAFTGSGLNDLTSSGAWDEFYDRPDFDIVIDGEGTPDTFTMKKNGIVIASGVEITGASQSAGDGVTFTFGATTGHTLNDEWRIRVKRVRKKNRAAYIYQALAWTLSVIEYHYGVLATINAAGSIEAVNAIVPDYSPYAASYPGTSIAGALAIPN